MLKRIFIIKKKKQKAKLKAYSIDFCVIMLEDLFINELTVWLLVYSTFYHARCLFGRASLWKQIPQGFSIMLTIEPRMVNIF